MIAGHVPHDILSDERLDRLDVPGTKCFRGTPVRHGVRMFRARILTAHRNARISALQLLMRRAPRTSEPVFGSASRTCYAVRAGRRRLNETLLAPDRARTI